jgi:hypothetical protein
MYGAKTLAANWQELAFASLSVRPLSQQLDGDVTAISCEMYARRLMMQTGKTEGVCTNGD